MGVAPGDTNESSPVLGKNPCPGTTWPLVQQTFHQAIPGLMVTLQLATYTQGHPWETVQ